jgi:Mg-chelatase subunit ChlD
MALFFRQLVKRFKPATVAVATRRPVATTQSRTIVTDVPPRRKPRSVPAYVLVVDQSASTGSTLRMAFGRTTSRIAAIQSAGCDYLQRLAASNPRQMAAVIGFSDTATLYHPLAAVGGSQPGLQRALQSLRPQASTNLSAGLASALGQLRRSGTTRGNIVLITDGAANMETERLPALVKEAQSRRVRIFAIGVGNDGDADYDKNLLFRMARSTGGRFASAHSYAALGSALQKAC